MTGVRTPCTSRSAPTPARVALRVLADDAARDEILVGPCATMRAASRRAVRPLSGHRHGARVRCHARRRFVPRARASRRVTLAERVAPRRPLPARAGGALAIGIAGPLEARPHDGGGARLQLRPEGRGAGGARTRASSSPSSASTGCGRRRWLSRRGRADQGTPPRLRYQAPEQLLTGEATHQSDVFAVGALLYRC